MGAAKEERDAYNAENQQLLKDRTRLELTIRDLSDEVMGDNKSKVRLPHLAKPAASIVCWW